MIALRVLRRGAVVRESLHDALPLDVGRGEASHVVLADASVSRAHARLERDDGGRLVLRDLGSRNGLFVDGRRVDLAVVAGALRCRVGGVELEIEPVADGDTLDLPAAGTGAHPARRAHRPWSALVALALATAGWPAVSLLDAELWSPWTDAPLALLLGATLGALVLLALLGFGLLVALKAVGREAHLADTLFALARLSWLVAAVAAVRLAARYVLAPEAAQAFSQLAVDALFVAGVAYLAGLRRHGPNLRFRIAWALAMALLVGGIETTAHLSARREGAAAATYTVLPPVGGWSGRGATLDAHLDRVRASGASADASASSVRSRQDPGAAP